MLAVQALERFSRGLASALSSMEIAGGKFGFPEYVEKQKREAEKLFQGYSKAAPSKEDAYAAALAFLRGHTLSAWQRDVVASALTVPISERGGSTVLASTRLGDLFNLYESEAKKGELWRLTYHGLLSSYFAFEPAGNGEDLAKARAGWETLREVLQRIWPYVDHAAGKEHVPAWVEVLRQESDVLTKEPTDKYATAYLAGNTSPADRTANDLGIPLASWFWHSIVLAAVRRAVRQDDAEFRRLVPRLLELIQSKPAFRDDAIEEILNRYHKCQGASPNERLRDYVIRADVWKNPKLKAANIATAWNRVSDEVWRMALAWVNERNLKVFFDILAARNDADEGRLAFWSRYLKQITWTRLVFGQETMALKSKNPAIRELIASEQGAYAELTAKKEVDAFMMLVSGYLIVEFSKKPNACYVYKVDAQPFNAYAPYYQGGSGDLGAGYHGDCAARIVHHVRWQETAADELRRLGIVPDRHDDAKSRPISGSQGARASAAGSTEDGGRRRYGANSAPDVDELRELVRRISMADVIDERQQQGGGRLWVIDRYQTKRLSDELTRRGFNWSSARNGWYYPEGK